MRTINLALFLLLAVSSNGDHFLKKNYGLPPPATPHARAQSPVLTSLWQRVDHFNSKDTRQWIMRYYANDQFYAKGGPLFIMIGGEWEIDKGWLQTGLMFDMAAQHRGYQFYTEHRYYGSSYPVEDLSSGNMKYLTAAQTLADLAHFIEYQKQTIPGAVNSKVVVVGASYAGSLATWVRLKYPHLVDAAWSSSGPLKATSDFHEYFEAIGTEIKRVDKTCYNNINDAMAKFTSNLKTSEGVRKMSTLFNTCNTIDTKDPEISYLYSVFANSWAEVIQSAADSNTIKSQCNYFKSFPGTNLEKLAGYMSALYDGSCIGDLKYFINWYNTAGITTDSTRQWIYQCCSEVGWYPSGTGNQPFAYWTNDYFMEICKKMFGITGNKHTAAVNQTNKVYGSTKPAVTKLVSVHGSLDPWKLIGAQEDINKNAPVIVVPEASHCADLTSISNSDSAKMRAAKTRIMSLISQWIK